jgi:hypothetical protein
LFPGFVALALAAVALWPPLTRTTVAYGLVLAVAIDLSFGPRGPGYDWLREHVVFYRGLRVPARFGQLALLAFAVLAALGCARLNVWLAGRVARPSLVMAGVLVLSFSEYLVHPLPLVAVPTAAPAAYAWLRAQPLVVLAELPMPGRATLPLHEARFAFHSIFHWHPLVNGYSGGSSDRYVALADVASGFPADASVRALQEAGVTHTFVHERFFGRHRYTQVLETLRSRTDIAESGRFDDDGFEIRAYRFTRGR